MLQFPSDNGDAHDAELLSSAAAPQGHPLQGVHIGRVRARGDTALCNSCGRHPSLSGEMPGAAVLNKKPVEKVLFRESDAILCEVMAIDLKEDALRINQDTVVVPKNRAEHA